MFCMRLSVFAIVCLTVGTSDGHPPAPLPKIHPRVFDMVTSWLSDRDDPVVTEINLDAVNANGNQFDFTQVRTEGGWTICPNDDNRGFLRFKQVTSAAETIAVEFQSNGGGTLTTSTRIEFVVAGREVRRNGQAVSLRVLRVIGISQN